MPTLCQELQLKKPTVNNFIDLLETAHLVYRLPPYGYGKEILRARYKLYLADAAMAPSVLLLGRALLEDGARMGVAVETAFFKHVYTRYYQSSVGFSYWKDRRGHEVDVIAEAGGRLVPFEVKYRTEKTGAGEFRGLQLFCQDKGVSRGYAITKDIQDFGLLPLAGPAQELRILKVPAPLACYWLSRSELDQTDLR